MTIAIDLTAEAKPKTLGRGRIPPASVNMSRVASIILGGGQGTRLYPLTKTRCKPAINFGGKYRLIDVPISNAYNSGCSSIYVLTQFFSSSIHQHILKTYHRGSFTKGFIDLLPAEQKLTDSNWFQGTADAVRRSIDYIIEAPVDYFLILSGDQLYNINFQKMVKFALEKDADLVIGALPVDENEAKRMGLLKLDVRGYVREFSEKPKEKRVLDKLKLSQSALEKLSSRQQKPYLGSMGIYLFKRKALFDLLNHDLREDFGKHLIPTIVSKGNVTAYIHDGYWEDIGTIESFYKANIALTQPNPEFNCYDEANPILAAPLTLPPSKIRGSQVSHSIICEGAIIEAAEVSNSILGPQTIVGPGSIIRDSYVMGNEFYSRPIVTESLPEELQIGENCEIRNAIIDKNVYIGKGVKLINKNKLVNYDGDNIYIRDGIIVVPRGTAIPSGFIL